MVPKISCPLEVGMRLVAMKGFLTNTVSADVTVTAVGKQNFLAMDKESKEHCYSLSHLKDYEMQGWQPGMTPSANETGILNRKTRRTNYHK